MVERPDTQAPTTDSDDAALRSFEDLRASGLLWLINASVFHPRGYALAFRYTDDGRLAGWHLLGDGTEPWVFEDGPDIDERFAAVARTFNDQAARALGLAP
jgi:YD repeat-containing protein